MLKLFLWIVALWLITFFVLLGTAFLLCDDGFLLGLFLALNVVVGVILPAWKCHLQHAKVLIRGPWDIPTAASMRLDYVLDCRRPSSSPTDAMS